MFPIDWFENLCEVLSFENLLLVNILEYKSFIIKSAVYYIDLNKQQKDFSFFDHLNWNDTIYHAVKPSAFLICYFYTFMKIQLIYITLSEL